MNVTIFSYKRKVKESQRYQVGWLAEMQCLLFPRGQARMGCSPTEDVAGVIGVLQHNRARELQQCLMC